MEVGVVVGVVGLVDLCLSVEMDAPEVVRQPDEGGDQKG